MKDNLIWPVWLITTHGLKKVFLGKKCIVVTQLTRMWCVCLWLGWEQFFNQKKWSKSVNHSVVSDYLWPPWTVALQAPLSMEFSRQEYWNGLLCPPLGDLSSPGMELVFTSPALAGRFFTTSTTWWGKEVLFYHIPRRSEVKWSRSVMSDSLRPYGL